MFSYFLIFYISISSAYLQQCQEYAEINKTYYNITCYKACEKLENKMLSLNCTELYIYSENFLNLCFAERCNDLDIQYLLNYAIYDINNLLQSQSSTQNITSVCNIDSDENSDLRWVYIFVCIIIFISLTICTGFNCRRLWLYNRSRRQPPEELLLEYS